MAFIGNTSNPQTYVPQIVYFSGNASTTAFTLPFTPASTAQVVVVVANVIQNPASAYTIIGNTLTFTSAPPTGSNNIWIEYASLSTQAVAPSAGTVNTLQLGTISNINSVGSSFTLQTNSNTAITVDQSGNLGLGNSGNLNYSARLKVYAGSNQQVAEFYGGGSNYQSKISLTNDYSGAAVGSLSGNLAFYANDASTERMRVDTSGKLLVGSQTPYSNAIVQAFQAVGSGAINFSQPSLSVLDTTAATAGVGGAIGFYGRYSTSIPTDFAFFGGIQGVKANSTQGDTACNLNFYTRPTLTAPVLGMSLLSTGTLQFQVSGQGIQFSNSSASVNSILNDYEVGTYSISDQSSGGVTITNNSTPIYTKIGNMVYAMFDVTYGSTSNGNNASFSTPFTAIGAPYQGGYNVGGNYGSVVSAQVNPNTATVSILNASTGSSLTNANLSGRRLIMTLVYRASF